MKPIRLPRKIAYRLHNLRIAGIERTAPLRAAATGLAYVSQIRHRDVRSWLVAIKSVAAAIGPGEFTALDDGSLTVADRSLLLRHVPGLRIISLADVATDGFPTGNLWERLLTILDLTPARYVVQVDADIVALAPIAEAAEAVRANRAFTLAGDPSAVLTSASERASRARQATGEHMQTSAERLLDALPAADRLRYVRGCAGFAGFPKGISRDAVAGLSAIMAAELGSLWNNGWGSEQIASNFAVANSGPDPVVLPWPRYPAFGFEQDISRAALIHFIGSHRYEDGVYGRVSRAAIQALSASRGPAS